MKSIFILLLLKTLKSQQKFNQKDCWDVCLKINKFDDQDLKKQIEICDKDCDDQNKYVECQKSCFQKSDNTNSQTYKLFGCTKICLKDFKEHELIEKRKQKFKEDPESHDGLSLKQIHCFKYMTEPKKKIYIWNNNKSTVIRHYFSKRCDFQVELGMQKKHPLTSYNWFDFEHQVDWEGFKEGQHIVNHVRNMRNLLSNKQGIYKTLQDYDKKNLFNYKSDNFHFDTYFFDLEQKHFTTSELDFFEKAKNRMWIAKSPDASLGMGLQVFKDINDIKQNVLAVKKKSKKDKHDDRFSVIQNYMHNPLLLKGFKFDVRSYILLASLNPFVVLYQTGFARRCIEKYDNNFKTFDKHEAFKHLTNRIYQAKHYKYQQEAENIMITPDNLKQQIQSEYKISDEKYEEIWERCKRGITYAMLAAKDKFEIKSGQFQLMGIDFIFDEDFECKLIELNTTAGLYTETKAHRNVVPQLIQTTYDLILDSYEDLQNVKNKWSNPKDLELGRWEIVINEAQNFTILDQFKKQQKNQDL